MFEKLGIKRPSKGSLVTFFIIAGIILAVIIFAFKMTR